jgi:cell division protein FtsB
MDLKVRNVFSVFLYVLLGMILVFSLAFVWPVYKKYSKLRDHVAELNEELSAKSAECIELNREVHDLEHKPSAAEKVAREKYNLCKDGELVLKYDK